MTEKYAKAPSLEVSDWLNTDTPLVLSELRGKVVVLHAFQMLCPGCVTHGIPQASLIYENFNNEELQVIGLHTVFENHQVMTKQALKVFVHEYRLRFPIGIDLAADSGAIPHTMDKFQLQGTPSLVLIDQAGKIRLTHLGQLSDIQVGNAIGQLLAEGQKT